MFAKSTAGSCPSFKRERRVKVVTRLVSAVFDQLFGNKVWAGHLWSRNQVVAFACFPRTRSALCFARLAQFGTFDGSAHRRLENQQKFEDTLPNI